MTGLVWCQPTRQFVAVSRYDIQISLVEIPTKKSNNLQPLFLQVDLIQLLANDLFANGGILI